MSFKFIALSLITVLFQSNPAYSCNTHAKTNPYYGSDVHSMRVSQNYSGLRETLHKVLDQFHNPSAGADEILEDCEASGCYRHKRSSYKEARRMLFGYLHLEETDHGYNLTDVYCGKTYTDRDSSGVGPNKIPNHTIVNTEHTWPQSKFSGRYPKEMQKTDLHALYPTNSKANSDRGNHQFRNVKTNKGPCGQSYVGRSEFKESGTFFEPPSNHKGNVARSLFYFAVRYNMKISKNEEKTLREWHKDDPIDEFEVSRHEEIFDFQRTRNPFIDYPELVSEIKDF